MHILNLIITINQFRYIKIQPKTIDLSTRLWGINTYSPEPCAEVYCLRLNFNISKLVYYNFVIGALNAVFCFYYQSCNRTLVIGQLAVIRQL